MSCKPIKDPEHPHAKIQIGCQFLTTYSTGAKMLAYADGRDNIVKTNLLRQPVSGWSGDDFFKGVSTINTGFMNEVLLSTEGGDDKIFGKSLAKGIHGRSDLGHGISVGAPVDLGPGRDSMKGISNSRGHAGVLVTNAISAGKGNDRLKGVGNVSSGIRIDQFIGGWRPADGRIAMGKGDDVITGVSKLLTNGVSILSEGGCISMGAGDDLLDFSSGGYRVLPTDARDGIKTPKAKIRMGKGDDVVRGFMADMSAKQISNQGVIKGGADHDSLYVESGIYTFSLNNGSLILSSNEFTHLRLVDFESVFVGTTYFDVTDLGAEGLLTG